MNPRGVSRVVTPSGLEVYYQSELHDESGRKIRPRLYRLRQHFEAGDIGPAQKILTEAMTGKWVEVPSVSNARDVLDKPGLPYWGMKKGIEGVLKLIQEKAVYVSDNDVLATHLADKSGLDPSGLVSPPYLCGREGEQLEVDDVVELLKERGLTVNQIRDQAGDRGTNVHDGLEKWAYLGVVPEPDSYPEEERGYVLGLRNALDQIQFAPETAKAEVMVGSLEHLFAGRYDLRVHLPEEVEIRINSRRSVVLPAGNVLLDLKTSKSIYWTHELQLAAYELASVECGYEPTDYQLVLRVGEDGGFEPRISRATAEDFLAVRQVYDVHERLKGVPK